MNKLLFALLFVSTSLAATFDVCVQALYWKPTNGDVPWATEFTLPPGAQFSPTTALSGRYASRGVSPNYSWGVRAGANTTFGWRCWNLSGSATYLRESQSAQLVGFLTPVLPFYKAQEEEGVNPNTQFVINGAGRSNLLIRYGLGNLALGLSLPTCGCLTAKIQSGVVYLYLRECLSSRIAGSYIPANAAGVSVALTQKRSLLFSGAGPMFGVDMSAAFWRCLEIDLRCQAMALIGTRRTDSRTFFNGPTVASITASQQSFHHDHCSGVTPGVDASCAIHYRHLGRLSFRVELGYSLSYYWAVFNQSVGSTTSFSSLMTQPNYRNVGFAGPYIGGAVSF